MYKGLIKAHTQVHARIDYILQTVTHLIQALLEHCQKWQRFLSMHKTNFINYSPIPLTCNTDMYTMQLH